MNEKLKIVVKKLYPNFRVDVDTPQEFYRIIQQIFNKHKDYFSKFFTPYDLIKIALYMYSLKIHGSFDWADRTMENLVFIVAFDTEKEPSVEECPDCGGSGNAECDYCDGSGRNECSECDGSGNAECSFCDGDGEIDGERCDDCDGTGKVSCDNCEGDGYVYCNGCGGDGSINCGECDGSGEIESDTNFNYTTYEICSWDSSLNSKAENVVQTFEPLADSDIIDYTEKRNFFVFNSFISEAELSEDVESNELYCLYVTETPELSYYINPLSPRMEIKRNLINNYLY